MSEHPVVEVHHPVVATQVVKVYRGLTEEVQAV